MLVALQTAWFAAAEPPTPDWPQVNGPTGNFNPRRYGHSLVDELSQIRQLWLSEDNDLGFCKGSSSGYSGHLADPATHPGTGSGLIVAEGKVFASSFKPAGDVWADNHPNLLQALASNKFEGFRLNALQRNAAIDADDLTVAIDLATGKTVWRAVEHRRGINRYSGKRLQFHATPAYHGGKVLSLGTMGIVYCYDAATGRKLWEESEGLLAKEMPAIKSKLLAERNQFAAGGGMGASLVVAQGVLIVPEFDTRGARDIGLRGVEIESGTTLWRVPAATCRFATPSVWSHEGRQYVLSATLGKPGRYDDGSLRLIDPQSGRVLWSVGGLAPTFYALSPSDSHVLVNVASAHVNPKKAKDAEPWGLMAAYRLSPTGAERAWTMPDRAPFWFENHMDICAMRRVLLRDGLVYFFAQGHSVDPAQTSRFVCILDEATGNIRYTSGDNEFKLGQFWLIEDRLLSIPDASHRERATLELLTIDPAGIRRLGREFKPLQDTTTAYEVFIELPYVDGKFLMRTHEGRVACYDLRKDAR